MNKGSIKKEKTSKNKSMNKARGRGILDRYEYDQ